MRQFPKVFFIALVLVFLIGAGILVYNFFKTPFEVVFNFEKPNISAGMVPHHLLAKDLIEEFFVYIAAEQKPETIVLLSPDHFNIGNIVGQGFITLSPESQEFSGIKIDRPLIKKLALENNLIFNNPGINLDHGITTLTPFVKKYFPDSKIAPFIIPFGVSLEKTEKFANSLDSLSSSKTIVVASVDFSHYLPSSVAEFHDVKSIRTLINFERENFEKLEVDSWQAIFIARCFAILREKEWPKIIGHYQSIDFLENQKSPDEGITSYFSVVFERLPSTARPGRTVEGKTILFVGDIMLDRGIEYLMEKNSILYPFEKISQFLKGVDIVFGNLEGPIVREPIDFPDESLKFTFSPETIEGLSFGNFNLLSLANNHTLDMGKAGLEETRDLLKESNIDFVGDPLFCSQDFSFEKDNIKFLAINKTFPFNCQDQEIIETVQLVKSENPESFLIVIIHWGEEYQLDSSLSQQNLAHKMIDAGAGLIIGSHSHVVQNIEIYQGKVVFYSLGNFIFDQYFSKETQEGLAVGLEIYPKRIIYRLFPIQSEKAQPSLMKKTEADELLKKLAEKSSQELVEEIKSGIIEIER